MTEWEIPLSSRSAIFMAMKDLVNHKNNHLYKQDPSQRFGMTEWEIPLSSRSAFLGGEGSSHSSAILFIQTRFLTEVLEYRMGAQLWLGKSFVFVNYASLQGGFKYDWAAEFMKIYLS